MRELLVAKEKPNCEQYDQEIVTEGFALLEKFDSCGVEKRWEKCFGG